MENNIPQGNTSMPVMPQMPSAPMPAAPTSVVSQMPTAPKATEGGSGMKITIAVLAMVILGGLGWYFFSKINMIPPPVEPSPATTRIPAKNLGPSTGASNAAASADMNSLTAIEGDMNNIDATADVDTSGIQ